MVQQVLDFWFKEIDESFWFKKDENFDALLIERFAVLHGQARQCELYQWRSSPHGRLAEVIILDQFSRNMFRDTPQAFAYDSLALALAQQAIAVNDHLALTSAERNFLYMPFMHSESLLIHEQAVKLFTENGNTNTLNFELKHKKIIEQFNRYPHRNAILGRVSTPEEIEFLTQPGSGF